MLSVHRDHRHRFRGALVGLAVGDAIGTTAEFKAPGSFEPLTDMVGGGPFSLPVGAWTDDTSMAMCLAESLIECDGFEPIDQLRRYVRWYRDGYWSSTGTCFDIGNATRAALERFEQTGEPYPGDAAPQAAGNGCLMRIAPIALRYALRPFDAARYAALSARTTHGAVEATDASRFFVGLLVGALGGASWRELASADPYAPRPGMWDSDPLGNEVVAIGSRLLAPREPPALQSSGLVTRGSRLSV